MIDDAEFEKEFAYLESLGTDVDKLTYWDEKRKRYTEPPVERFDGTIGKFVPEN